MILGNITDVEYFSRKEISNSDLKLIDKSISHFLNKNDMETTANMNFGKAFHALLLEETKFYEQFIVAPADMDRRTKEGKATYQALLDSGREIITAQEWNELNQLKQNVLAHPIARNILIGAEFEGAITGEIDGVPMRAKIDIVNKGYIVDLKTCQDASKSAFMRSIGQFSYHQQAAVYLELCKQNNIQVTGFLFIAVERNAKQCGVACYSIDQESIDLGMQKAKKSLKKYKDYLANTDKYTGYSDSIEPIGAPSWVFYEGTQ